MRPVLTKADFVRRYRLHEFGNHSPTWDTLEEFLASGYNGLVHIRNRVAGGLTWYNVPADRVSDCWQSALELNYRPEQLYLSAMCPTELTTFQGEIQQSVRGLDLRYTTVRKPMREALAVEGRTVSGILSLELLRYYLCANSYEWMTHLLNTYDGHVIEFTALSKYWGTEPFHNTLVWEVRLY